MFARGGLRVGLGFGGDSQAERRVQEELRVDRRCTTVCLDDSPLGAPSVYFAARLAGRAWKRSFRSMETLGELSARTQALKKRLLLH